MNNYLIKNARIWTAEKDMPWADCIAVRDKKIEFVGSYSEYNSKADVEVDANGKMMIPSFMDSHTHIVSTAKTLWCLLLERKEYESIDEIMEIVKEYAEKHPKEEVPYIYAYSCPTHLMDVEYADRYFMDKYVSDRPVLLCDLNFHRSVVNSKMLELMEVDETVPYDPSTSCNYDRYEGNVPSGVIQERAFEFRHDIDKMFDKLGWYPPSESDPEILSVVLERMTDYGICGLHDGFADSEDVFKGIKALKSQGRLNHYYHTMPLLNSFDDLEETIKTANEWREKYNDEHIIVDSIKYFLDGTNELGTGAVIEPFIDDPNNFGKINMSEDELTVVFERLNQENLSIQIHLVGDRSYRTALNAVERAKKSEAAAGRDFTIRVSLLHCEIIHPDDRRRAAELGVFVNFTPVWAGGAFGDGAKKFIGEERFNNMYSFKELIEAGTIVNFSADIVDEESLPEAEPMVGIQVGHTRKEIGSDIIREPESECFTIEELLTGYTINNAKGMGIEDKTGSLKVGKMANFCILSDNIFEVKPEDIHKIKPEVVAFEGKVVRGTL